jgi:ribosomal protein L11 methyltransferase
MEKFYYELVVTPSSHYQLFLDFILQISENGLEEFDGSIILRANEPFKEVVWGINHFREKLEKSLGETLSVDISETERENRDWIEGFKQSVQPVSIEPFYIYPSWHEPKEGAVNISIDPALAFGSGHHETTAMCIDMLGQIDLSGEKVLDVGTGSGILSIVSAKMGAEVDFCDIDPVAVESARENFLKNGLQFRDSWVGSVGDREKYYSLVVANIIPDVIIAISKDLKERVDVGGQLILSGILESRERQILESFQEFKLIKKLEKGEWVALLLQKEKI